MSILFTNVTAVTMDPENPVLKDAFVAVEGNKIASIGDQRPDGEFERVIDCGGKVMLPGFVNAHTHVPMTLMRGYGGGCDLHTWLNQYIFPAEARLDDRCVAAGAALGLAEMIASGTTCIADMYMNTETIAQAVLDAGISANLACGAVYFGAPEDFSPETCNDCGNHVRLYENWHGAGDGQLLVDASIHAEYTSCPPAWEWVADFAQKHNLRMHVHVSETLSEHEKCIDKYGTTPAQLLDRYGVWQNGGIAAHCVHLSGGDAELLAKRGVTAVHNPVSNLKLMSGVAPLFFLRDCGMNVALGTDGVASNNSHNIFEE
ncbi:MAG: amidohydrolase family protein, partial [Lawsonibacter sp.]|nr:amidohydrolase family protein [Lawsonibacter sp.]